MTSYVAVGLRRTVEARANRACEYCLIHESDTFLGCQVDHVLSEKHGGLTESDNLAYACTLCNRAKGTDVGSIGSDGEFVRFFNPRVDRWEEHFRLRGAAIDSTTLIGEVTLKIFEMNAPERLVERESLQRTGRYPSPKRR